MPGTWLECLEEHASRPEDPAVWNAFADDLRFLVHADHTRASAFLDGLLEHSPALGDSIEGVRLLAWTQAWLPDGLGRRTIFHWINGHWKDGRQATGELVALRCTPFRVLVLFPTWRHEQDIGWERTGLVCGAGAV